MANRTIVTDFFRLSHPHLATRHSVNNGTPKFEVTMLFPKVGALPPEVSTNAPASANSLINALNEVCMEEWQCSFADAPANRGISNPAKVKDGDLDPTLRPKDDNGNRTLTPRPEVVGQMVVSARNIDEVGLADAHGSTAITADKFYSGCYCRAQLQISAYNCTAGDVISITLQNLQKCYDGASLGGKAPTQTADQAFGAIADTNIAVGADQSLTPVAPAQPQAPQTQPPTPPMTETAPVLEPHENTPDYLNPPPAQTAAPTPPPPAPPEKSYNVNGQIHTESVLRDYGYTDGHFATMTPVA